MPLREPLAAHSSPFHCSFYCDSSPQGPPEFERIFSTALVSPVLPYLESLMPSEMAAGRADGQLP